MWLAGKVLSGVFNRSLPDLDGTFKAELDKPAEAKIERDSFGIPHITAATEKDLYFLNGVCHGQDRLWQLHSARMLASGRLSEFAGAKALDLDRLLRQLGFRVLAEEDLASMQGSKDKKVLQSVDNLQAYCDGVTWAMQAGKMMPVECWLVGQRKIDAWTMVDSLAVMRLYGFIMCFGFQQTLLRHALVELFGKERALAWTQTVEENATIPNHMDEESLKAFRSANLTGVFNQGTADLPRDQGSNWWILHGKHTESGKPLLVGDPHLTIKIPMFWYEAHLNLKGEAPFNNYGVSPPGVPGQMVGHNNFYCTSITLGYCDVEDIFLERFRESDGKYLHKGEWKTPESRKEVIVVKGQEPEEMLCRTTCHGAILEGKTMFQFDPFKRNAVEQAADAKESDGFNVQIAYAGATRRAKSLGIHGIFQLARCRSFTDVDAALAHVSPVISLNFAYADVDGHIGYILTGEVPIRGGPRGSELFPLIGWTGENDWTGYVPHAELPKAYDPPSGIIISANHKIVDYAHYPHYLGAAWKSGYRAQAIQEELKKLMEGGAKVSIDQMPGMLSNLKSWAAVEFVEELKDVTPDEDQEVAEALKMLLGWDGDLAADSVPAALYQVTHAELVKLLLKDGFESMKVPPSTPTWEGLDEDSLKRMISGESFDPSGTVKLLNEMQGHLHLNVIRILRSAKSTDEGDGRRWWLDQVGGKSAAVNEALKSAVEYLRGLAGDEWQTSEQATWGVVHICHIPHPLTKNLGLAPGSPPFDIPSSYIGGDTNTIKQTCPKSITDFTATSSNVSLRVIYDLSDLTSQKTNTIVLPVGQSGQFNSQHYSDQYDLWKSSEMRPMRVVEEDITAAAVNTMRFEAAVPTLHFEGRNAAL